MHLSIVCQCECYLPFPASGNLGLALGIIHDKIG